MGAFIRPMDPDTVLRRGHCPGPPRASQSENNARTSRVPPPPFRKERRFFRGYALLHNAPMTIGCRKICRVRCEGARSIRPRTSSLRPRQEISRGADIHGAAGRPSVPPGRQVAVMSRRRGHRGRVSAFFRMTATVRRCRLASESWTQAARSRSSSSSSASYCLKQCAMGDGPEHAADQRGDHGDPRVAPVGAAFAGDRQ